MDKEIPELFFVQYFTPYCYLSSYIHGGPFAERMLIKYQDIEKRDKRIIYMAETAFEIFHSSFSLGLTIMGVFTDNKNYIILSDKVAKIALN